MMVYLAVTAAVMLWISPVLGSAAALLGLLAFVCRIGICLITNLEASQEIWPDALCRWQSL